ncbi:MAG: hypothetical protein COW63_08875 [Bacteroidetes bacterium CG18_big_fil_WC_8_21_14_2_50_41_14]|nr:MAG: hypothetical protein COW63_08875 [Bacteroidetes bacterium CG18_big_fil_WC_8_21_14_2_50_41_14]
MLLKSEKVIQSLSKKGFKIVDSHHKFMEYYLDGKPILHTKISQGANHDLDNFLIAQMSKQCKLSKKDFLDLANCPLSKENYEKKIRDMGLDK